MDDPFSALDAHVGRTVFERLVGSCKREVQTVLVLLLRKSSYSLLWQGRLVVFSTHALHLAPQCDVVTVIAPEGDTNKQT
jgi:ABC-type nitrate/sulfonate/bicarbonate transport system ATPase subunit